MLDEIVSTRQFNEALLKAEAKLMVVNFSTDWHGPCIRTANSYKALSEKYKQVCFYTLNLEKCANLGTTYEIMEMPTFVIYKNGVKLDYNRGINMDDLEAKLKYHLGPEKDNVE
ncbi:thioredoxin-like [Teleopsis dalmanni]|uniref:thioredoxin-like n=1 Tax=Teleopsis dalmanni TaxID=139649 RepID=UPI0018CE3E24|nr:thioredoxin-like [Teleopsis dalmanni]